MAGVGGALLLSALAMSLLVSCAAPSAPRAAVDGPAFTSIFQGATRWQTYVALAVSGSLFGHLGLAIASVAMIAIVPLVNVFSVVGAGPLRLAGKALAPASIVMTVASNPLIWACAIGLAVNVTHFRCPGSGTTSPTRSAVPPSASACW